MPHGRPKALSVSVEAADEARTAWFWAIHREPDGMLIVRSRPDYVHRGDALKEGRAAAQYVGVRLNIPYIIVDTGDVAD